MGGPRTTSPGDEDNMSPQEDHTHSPHQRTHLHHQQQPQEQHHQLEEEDDDDDDGDGGRPSQSSSSPSSSSSSSSSSTTTSVAASSSLSSSLTSHSSLPPPPSSSSGVRGSGLSPSSSSSSSSSSSAAAAAAAAATQQHQTIAHYQSQRQPSTTSSVYDEGREREFELSLKTTHGWYIKRMAEDGNCLFRSIADQLYGDAEMHDQVRKHTMDYMEKERDHFSQFVADEDFDHYIARKRNLKVYGNHAEIQAMCEMFNRPIEVYSYSTEPLNIYSGLYKTDSAPIRLSYHLCEHYNSVIDPHSATIGVGLGLPGLVPGGADKSLIQEVKMQSEQEEVEAQLYESSLLDEAMALSRKEIESGDVATGGAAEEELPAWILKDLGVLPTRDVALDRDLAELDVLEAVRLASMADGSAYMEDEDISEILAESREEYLRSLRERR